MSGQLPSFMNGSTLEIWIGSARFAYAQALSFSDDMTVTPVGGMGSFNYHALEPTDYAARGSIVITQYSRAVLARLKTVSANSSKIVPGNVQGSQALGNGGASGNSLLKAEYFSPPQLLTSLSFDINVYDKKAGTGTGSIIYQMINTRFGSYAIGFSPGSLVSESLSFVCTSIIDHRSETDKAE